MWMRSWMWSFFRRDDMSVQQLRIFALKTAIRTEGAKAVTVEVLEAADQIWEFLTEGAEIAAPKSELPGTILPFESIGPRKKGKPDR
jgi:hypothetical protein